MLLVTRILGALAALAGMVAFTCHFAVPVDVGRGSILVSEATATYRNAGIAVHLLLLAALGLTAAARPAVGARVVALGGVGLPWLAGVVGQLWAAGVPGVVRMFAAAVLLGLVVVGAAVIVAVREVRWSGGGVLLGDGVAVVVAAAVLWGLLGANWYRVRELTVDALIDGRFGSQLEPSTAGGRATWVAAALAVLALAVAVSGGGWGRRVAGWVVGGLCAFEIVRRVFLSGDRLISPGERQFNLSGEPVLALLVLPLVGIGAGAWFLTTPGEAPVDDSVDDSVDDEAAEAVVEVTD
ncbi:MAG TPA: hypothetical protein VK507_00380 [Iamia sp.]|nr:hypothetical protein [Iamia sp.]